jgi:hypothetical protein
MSSRVESSLTDDGALGRNEHFSLVRGQVHVHLLARQSEVQDEGRLLRHFKSENTKQVQWGRGGDEDAARRAAGRSISRTHLLHISFMTRLMRGMSTGRLFTNTY